MSEGCKPEKCWKINRSFKCQMDRMLQVDLDFSHLRVKPILFVKMKEIELLFASAAYPDRHALVPKSKERCCYGQAFKEVS